MDQANGLAGCGCGGAPRNWLTSSWLTSPLAGLSGLGHGGTCCAACAKGLPCVTVSGMGEATGSGMAVGGLGGIALLAVGYFVGRAASKRR